MTRRETRRTRRVRWLAALLGAFVLALSVMPVTAWAAPGANSLEAVYVSSTGDDENGDGSQGSPLATLAKAVDAAKDGGTIYVMTDIESRELALVSEKDITIDGDGHTVTRGENFAAKVDGGRGGYNPAMIEVANNSELTLVDITLDDGFLTRGTEFELAGDSTVNNENKVHDGIIASYGDGHSTIVLGEGTTLKNFGGLSAVYITGLNGEGATLVMKPGSKICDDPTGPRRGGYAAIYNHGGTVNAETGSSIENIDGRAIYADNGGVTTFGGSIENVTSNKVMKEQNSAQTGFGGVVYFGDGNTKFTLDEGGSISNITSHDGKASGVMVYLGGNALFKTEDDSSISKVHAIGVANNNGGTIEIGGTITECHADTVLIRLRNDANTFRLLESGEMLNNAADTALVYMNMGKPTIEIAGTIDSFNTDAIFVSVNGAKPDGAVRLTETGLIKNVKGDAIVASDPSRVTVAGAISDCDGYAVNYNPKSSGSLLDVQGTARISNNNGGGAQIQIKQERSLYATSVSEHAKIAPGALQGNTSIDFGPLEMIDLTPFDVTLDEGYEAIALGHADPKAVTAIEDAVSKHPGWMAVGDQAVWMQPSDVAVHFTASRSSNVKNTGLFMFYVPLDEKGKPDGEVDYQEVGNGSTIDVTLEGLTAGRPYALMLVNNAEYTLTADDVTKYIGGGDGSETEGSSFPELTINGSVDLTYKKNPVTEEYGYDLESLKVGTEDFSATEDQSLLDQLVSLLEVTYTYEDGTVATDDSKPGVYTITLGWRNGLTDGDVRVNGNNVKIGGTGTLIVRHTQDVEHAQDGTITYKLLETEPTDTVKNAVAMANGSSPEFYTNDDETREAAAAGVQLLDDDLLVYEGEDRRTPMEEKAAKSLGKPDEGRAYRYEFHYLDLVDAYNGNAWVSASDGTTVWLPYPEGVTAETADDLKLKVVHYKDLHREYGITGQENVDQAIADCEMETMEVTCEANGIRFDVERSGFSPFAVVWQTKAHTITASAGNGGTIAPSGTVTVAEGADQTFTITPSQGYEIADVKVNGESKGAVTTYTFNDVTDDHKIEAAFRSTSGGGTVTPSERYTITATAGEGGSISPSGTHSYAAGSDVTFTITPDEGWTVGDVTVDGVSYRQLGSYTFEDLDDDHTISVTFMRGSDPASPDDTGVSDWLNASDHVAYLHGYGDGSGKFGPENPMTRAEVAQMFYNLLLDKSMGERDVAFEDVPDGAYYAEPVRVLASRGILNGTSPETFEPDRAITRAEFVAIAMRFSNGEFDGENPYVDVPEDAWYRDYVVGATSFGWIYGYQDGSGRFGPDDTITRGQATMVTNRMLWRSCDTAWALGHLDQVKTFVDLPQGHYAFFDVVEATNAHDYERVGGTRFEDWTGLRE